MKNNSPLLCVKDLSVKFSNNLVAVDNLSFTLSRGETLAIVGESGSGKSVTCMAIMRLIEYYNDVNIEGEILLNSKDILKMSKKEVLSFRGSDISMVYQDPMMSLNPVLTIGAQICEVIVLHEKISYKQAKDRAIFLLKKVRLPDAKRLFKSYPHELSGGMRQRVMIAMALCCKPKLLIADEPTTALDVSIQAQILYLIKELQKEYNTSIIFITHDMGVVAQIADRVVVMYKGKNLETSHVKDIFYKPKHLYTKALLESFKLKVRIVIFSMLSFLSTAFGSTLNVSISQDPASWDPIDTYLVAWSIVSNNIFDGLIQRDVHLKLKPALATSWEFLDNNKTIRFHLRKGVTFHNGEPFNANAVKFTFERLLGKEGRRGPQRSNYKSIDSVKIIDNYTVDFHLAWPDPVLLTKLSGYGAMIVPPKYIKKHGDAYFNLHPVGTGPFKMSQYKPKISVTLDRYDNFFGQKAKLDHILYHFIKEKATQVAELQAGNLDIISRVPVEFLPQLQKSNKINIVSVPGIGVYSFRFNTKRGITKNLLVRKAITLAIDRQTIINTILMKQAKLVSSFQSPLSFGYDKNLPIDKYDPIKAKKLLKEALIKPGAKLEINYRSEHSTFGEVAQAVAGYLSVIGFKVTIKPYESGIYISSILPKGKTGQLFEQSWGGWTLDYDNTAYLMYHTGEFYNPYYSYEKLDKLLEKQRSYVSPPKRLPILKEIGKFVHDQYLEIPMYNNKEIYGVSKRVHNFDAPVDNRFRFNLVTVE